MKMRKVSAAGKARLKRVGLSNGPTLNALSVAFQEACRSLHDPKAFAVQDEIEMTAAFLGALRQSIEACAEEFGDVNSPACTWVQYPKQGTTINESRSGADFAIAIRSAVGLAQLALFQAKKAESETPTSLQLHRMAPALSRVPEEPQFIRLLKYAAKIIGRRFRAALTLRNLEWVHYLHYLKNKPCQSYSVDQMDSVRQRYLLRTAKNMDAANSLRLSALQAVPFTDLLRGGAEWDAGASAVAKGWLVMNDADLKVAVLDLTASMDVFEGIDTSFGPVLTLITTREAQMHEIHAVRGPSSGPEVTLADALSENLVDDPKNQSFLKPKRRR